MKDRAKLLADLFGLFFRVGLFTFGGGYAMLSVVEDACVDRRGWLTREEMGDLTVVAESTPGPIAINCATYVGARQGGLAGAAAATLGVVLPSFLVILLISRYLDRLLALPLVANAFRGIQLAVGILILDAGRRLFRQVPKTGVGLGIFFAALAAMVVMDLCALRISSIVLLLLGGTVSLFAYSFSHRDGRGGREP